MGLDYRGDRYGAYIIVNQEVKLSSSHLARTPLTLLTRIGGIIGVGKEFLWIVLTMNAFFISCTQFLHIRFIK